MCCFWFRPQGCSVDVREVNAQLANTRILLVCDHPETGRIWTYALAQRGAQAGLPAEWGMQSRPALGYDKHYCSFFQKVMPMKRWLELSFHWMAFESHSLWASEPC